MRITSMNRAAARSLKVFEFPQTMPTDNLSVDPGSRLSPIDCNLTTEFIAVTEEVDNTVTPPEPDPGTDACAHPVCEEGEKLDPGCSDACVQQVCEADAFCCNNSWDNVCVGQVTSVCGQTCS